jgi:hypothetical protein
MALRYQNFQPVKYGSDRHSFSGVLAVAAVAGMIINVKSDAADAVELSTGKAGFFLRENVLADAAALKAYIEQDILHPNAAGFRTPAVAGGTVQAEDIVDLWVEGAALLDAAMDGTVAAGAQLTSAAGKWKPVTDATTQETLGIVRRVIAAQNAGSGYRFRIQIVRDGKAPA